MIPWSGRYTEGGNGSPLKHSSLKKIPLTEEPLGSYCPWGCKSRTGLSTHSNRTLTVLCLVTQFCPTLCDPKDCSPPGGFSRQKYEGGLPCPPPGDIPNPGIKLRSPALQVDSLLSEPPGKSKNTGMCSLFLLQGTSQSRNRNRVSCISGKFFTS